MPNRSALCYPPINWVRLLLPPEEQSTASKIEMLSLRSSNERKAGLHQSVHVVVVVVQQLMPPTSLAVPGGSPGLDSPLPVLASMQSHFLLYASKAGSKALSPGLCTPCPSCSNTHLPPLEIPRTPV